MPKQFPTESEWQAPWEKNGTEFNADVAKHLIYSLSKSEAQLEEELASSKRELRTAKQETETLSTESETLKREALFGRKAMVAAEHNIPLNKAKWLGGDTLEEIEASAKEFLKDFATPPEGEGEKQEEPPAEDKGGEQPEPGQPGGKEEDDPLMDFFLRRTPVATSLFTGAHSGTDGEQGKPRPAETIDDARQIVTGRK